jgi:hypothetical protein
MIQDKLSLLPMMLSLLPVIRSDGCFAALFRLIVELLDEESRFIHPLLQFMINATWINATSLRHVTLGVFLNGISSTRLIVD